MAIANTKSTIVTNGDAEPAASTSSFINKGRAVKQTGFVEVLAADDDNSVYRFHRVPSGVRVSSVKMKNDAITVGSDYNLGFYDVPDNGGLIVGGGNELADNLDLTSARDIPTEVLSGVVEEDSEKRIWELLGLSEDPHVEYDVCLTAIAVGSSVGTIQLEIEYLH